MQRGKKVAAAVVLLGLGLGTALLFPRADQTESAAEPTPAMTQNKESLALRESGEDATPTQGSRLGPIPLKPSVTATPPRDLNEPIAVPRAVGPPPDLAPRFDRSLMEVTSPRTARNSALTSSNTQAESLLGQLPAGPRPLRVHRVVDGDTLSRLAERFLGDATRSEEIHALNQSQLSDPNLLPIGVELKIPPREGVLALRPVSEPADPSGSREESLSPIPPAPSEGELVPVPAGLPHSNPR